MFIKKKLTYAAAMAILFGAYAGCGAWAEPITETVTEDKTGETKYEIKVTGANAGVRSSSGTDITIGGKDTKSVTIETESGTGIYAEGGSVNLTASDGNTITTTTSGHGIYVYRDGNVTLESSNGNNEIAAAQHGIYVYDPTFGTSNPNVTLKAENGSNIISTTSGHCIYVYRDGNVTLESSNGNNEIAAAQYGIYVFDTTSGTSNPNVTLKAENGRNIISGSSHGIGVSGGSSTGTSVVLEAQSNKISGGRHGIELNSYDNGHVKITATGEAGNTVTGGTYGINVGNTYNGYAGSDIVELIAENGKNTVTQTDKSSGSSGDTSSAIKADNGGTLIMLGKSNEISADGAMGIMARDGSTVNIKATGEDGNSVTANDSNYGLFAQTSELTLEAERGDNQITATGTGLGFGVASNTNNSEYGTSSTVTLTAGGNNTITSSGSYGFGIHSSATNNVEGESTSSTVTLTAGGNNTITTSGGSYGMGIYSYSYATNDADDESISSTVTLKAGGNNTITASGSYGKGIYSYATDSSTSTVTLEAEQDNIVIGSAYGIHSISSNGGSSSVTLNATGNNTISGSTFAVYTTGGSEISVTSGNMTTLEGYYGAAALSGGKAEFSGAVQANAAVVAYADGENSSVTFNDGLTNAVYGASSIIQALNGGVVSVNESGSGTVQYTGTTSVWDETADTIGTVNMNLTNSASYWYMTGDSAATSLGLSGGALLDMTKDGNAFSTLRLNSLTGDGGTIYMDVDAANNVENSDRIYIDGTHTGTHYITLNNIGDHSASAHGTVLVTVSDEQGTFKVHDSEGTLYWNTYSLESKDSVTGSRTADASAVADNASESNNANSATDWYLSGVSVVEDDNGYKETTTVNTGISAASLNYHSWMMQNTKLLQRLGDLRQGANDGVNGTWFRINGSKLSYGGDHGFENKYIEYQAGYDKIVEQTSKYTMYGGIALSYSNGDSSYNSGSGDNESKAVSLYFTQINKGGSYLDVVFKLGRWENDFKVYDTVGRRIEGETESTGLSLSAEYGKKIALGNKGLYIEPQAQLTYGHFDGDSYTMSNGVNVHADSIESLVGRVGFNLGWDINPRANVYLKANVLHEFLGDYGITFSDATGRLYRSGDYSDTWFLYGLGAAFKLGRANSGSFLYFDAERSTGGDLDQEWFYNVGFRFVM